MLRLGAGKALTQTPVWPGGSVKGTSPLNSTEDLEEQAITLSSYIGLHHTKSEVAIYKAVGWSKKKDENMKEPGKRNIHVTFQCPTIIGTIRG